MPLTHLFFRTSMTWIVDLNKAYLGQFGIPVEIMMIPQPHLSHVNRVNWKSMKSPPGVLALPNVPPCSFIHSPTNLSYVLKEHSHLKFHSLIIHYQGRIDFNTDNLFHSAGMDLACFPASREGLTNPLPRGKINQSSP